MTTLRDDFLRLNKAVCERCFKDPACLKKKAKDFPGVLAKFRGQANTGKQGLGNKETDHEVCFAALLEEYGFQFLLKKKTGDHLKLLENLADGLYYIYQVNGPQRPLDFQTILVQNHIITRTVTYDLKHTSTDVFYLNDGWFKQDIVYVITWSPNKVDTPTVVALGQKIPSAEESILYKKHQDEKNLLNSEDGVDGSDLIIYYRFANRYKCKKFTPEWSQNRYDELMTFLSV